MAQCRRQHNPSHLVKEKAKIGVLQHRLSQVGACRRKPKNKSSARVGQISVCLTWPSYGTPDLTDSSVHAPPMRRPRSAKVPNRNFQLTSVCLVSLKLTGRVDALALDLIFLFSRHACSVMGISQDASRPPIHRDTTTWETQGSQEPGRCGGGRCGEEGMSSSAAASAARAMHLSGGHKTVLGSSARQRRKARP